jgi:hypothetical protein
MRAGGASGHEAPVFASGALAFGLEPPGFGLEMVEGGGRTDPVGDIGLDIAGAA